MSKNYTIRPLDQEPLQIGHTRRLLTWADRHDLKVLGYPYSDELAGPDGSSYWVYVPKGAPQQELEDIVRELRHRFDVVSFAFYDITSVPALSQQEHLGLSADRTACPRCLQSEITGDQVEMDHPGEAHQTIFCNTCEYSWTNDYKLAGYREVEG